MKHSYKLVFLLLFCCASKCFGQDTLCYCRKPSFWISECYYFFKINSLSKEGQFTKIMESDDGQTWIGKGSFTENENRVQLRSYNLIRTVSHFSYDSSGNMTLKSLSRDSTLIHKYNFAKKKDNLGSIYLELKSKEQKIKIRYEKRISISYPNSIIKINSSVALPKNDWIPKRRDK